MSRSIADVLPLLGLRITAGPLELRGITDNDLVALGELAEAGIHADGAMPFYVPWTTDGSVAHNIATHHWRKRAEFAVGEWSLELAVRYDGVLVGAQGFRTRSYLVTRTGESGSWLGLAHQGRGIGTLMRQTLCGFLFDHLAAVEVRSGAFLDNPASLAVSRKVGYRPAAVQRLERRPGELALNQDLVLVPADLVRSPYPLEVAGLEAFRRSIGLDADPLP